MDIVKFQQYLKNIYTEDNIIFFTDNDIYQKLFENHMKDYIVQNKDVYVLKIYEGENKLHMRVNYEYESINEKLSDAYNNEIYFYSGNKDKLIDLIDNFKFPTLDFDYSENFLEYIASKKNEVISFCVLTYPLHKTLYFLIYAY